jgi:hypothetical protein
VKKDRHVRYPEDPGPLVGGQGHLRYTLCNRDDPDVVRVRQDIPHEGRGLFVVRLGDTGVKALIEAYYPEDIRAEYAKRQLDRFRLYDMKMGRLVAVAELFKWVGEIDPRRIREMSRNARNVHSHLKRNHDMEALVTEMHNEREARESEALNEWMDFYADAYVNTMEHAMGKPRVSQYNPSPR